MGAPRLSQRLHQEREAKWESRSEAARIGATVVLPGKAEREEVLSGAVDARL